MYVRDFKYKYPQEYFTFNDALFKLAKEPFNASAFGVDGAVFASYQEEHVQTKQLSNNWFPPIRTNLPTSLPDYLIVSNNALVPEMRITMMAPFADYFAKLSEAPVWRYDALDTLIRARHGSIALPDVFDIMTFLAPDRTPGYWGHMLYPGQPMSAQGTVFGVAKEEENPEEGHILNTVFALVCAAVEGAVSVVDLTGPQGPRIHTKTGYWADPFVNITLLAYC